MAISQDLGMVTAYAYAVSKGYTGTEEQFANEMANIADMSATANTLAAGSSATANYSNGTLTLGIPKGDKGDTGDTGAQGVSIVSVVQTTTSTDDDGNNIITVTLSNGNTSTFTVQNGSKGSTGATGRGIQNVYLTGTVGKVNTYTILFTDGTTFDFNVTDGEVTQAQLDTTNAEVSALKSALQQGYITANTFVQGGRSTDIIVVDIATRCTISKVFELHEGDKIEAKNIDNGLRVAVAGVANNAFVYDSGWQTTDQSYTVPNGKDGTYFVNVAKTDNSNITPSDISTLSVKVTPKSLILATKTQVDDLQSAFEKSLMIPNEATVSALSTPTPFYAKAGDYIVLKSADGSAFTSQRINLLDKNKNVVDWWNITGSNSPRGITLSSNIADMYYVRFDGGTAQTITVTNTTSVYNTTQAFEELDDDLFELENITDVNLVDNYFTIDNKYLDVTTGNAYGSVNYKCTDFIACKNGDSFGYRLYGTGADDALILKYDINKAFQSVLLSGSGAIVTGTITLSEDCYIRVSNRFAAYDTPSIIFNSTVVGIKKTLDYNGVWDVPEYTQEEIETVVSNAKAKQGTDTISFAFITDIHNGNATNIRAANHHAIQSIYKIEKKIPLDYVVFGGDYLSNGASTTVDQCYAQIDDLMKYIAEIKTDAFMLRGNHDSNPFNQSAPFTDAMFYKSTDKFFETKDIHMYTDDLGKCIGYVDLENLKVRLIFTNTTDVGTQADGFGMTNEQIAWFGNVALNFSDKTDKENWGVIVFAHTYFVSSSIIDVTVSQAMHSILVAFKNGTAYDNYDFTQQGAMEVICAVVGHQHADKSALVDGIRVIATMQTAGGGDETADDGNTYAKVWGTADETAYDIFTIDRTAKKIYTTRFGVGQDREWSY